MREFRYKALTTTGQTVEGLRHAPSVEELASSLGGQGLTLLSSRSSFGSLGFKSPSRVKGPEIRDFTLHMGTTLSAGIPMMEALKDFQEGCGGKDFKNIVSDLHRAIAGGSQLSEALGGHSHVFPDIYVAIIEAGEATGNLDRSFADLVNYLEWSDDLNSQTKQMMMYPAMLGTATIGLFLLMSLYVIPQFQGAFSSQSFKLPTLTVKVMGVGDFMGTWWPFMLGFSLAAFVGVKMARTTPSGRYHFDRLVLQLPVVGHFVSNLSLSRFARYFSLLLGSGLDVLRALQLLQKVVGNAVMEKELIAVHQGITGGGTLRESFDQCQTFPILIKRLIAVGEKTGSLDTTLIKASEHIDKELPRTLKQAYTVLEAVILVFLGTLVAVCALAMLLPIFQLRSQIG
ncbi:MAG: type II secretion system F family protein [Gemmatimonadales bacterium]|nr:type II secretion system F family protein [Gemmatimonadales bacterium]